MNDRAAEIRSTRAPTLREDQIEILRRYGQTKKTDVGDILFRAGDTSRAAEGGSYRGAQPLRYRPQGLPREACVYDQDRPGSEDNRLAPLDRRGAPEGDRGPQPGTPRLDRARGESRGRRGLAREIRSGAVRDTCDRLAGQRRAEEADQRRVCPHHGS